MSGQTTHRADILNITNSYPCEIQTTEEHGFESLQFVRLTDLNGMMPTPRGEDPLNNNRYRIIKTGLDSFQIQNPITYQFIDSSGYPPYVTGGSANRVPTDFYYYGDDE